MSNTTGSKPKYSRHELTITDDLVEDDSGGVTLHNATLLAEGNWHDSLGKEPLNYSAENLTAAVVDDPTGWRIHEALGRHIDDEIGEVRNVRYDAPAKAIIGDLFFHKLTEASRNVLGTIRARHKAGRPIFVSVEHLSNDKRTEHGLEATDIHLTGWVVTDKPACKKCSIPKQMEAAGANMAEEGDNTPTYVTKEEFDALTEQFAELKAEFDKIKPAAEKVEEIAGAVDEAKKELTANKKAITALEKTSTNKAPTAHALENAVKPVASYSLKGGY